MSTTIPISPKTTALVEADGFMRVPVSKEKFTKPAY
jgi:hypothetical protein